jgi:hypothetical protein
LDRANLVPQTGDKSDPNQNFTATGCQGPFACAAQTRNAAGSLQTFVSVLRSHLSEDRERARKLVITEAEAYRFATALVDLDLDRFDQLLECWSRQTNAALANDATTALRDRPTAIIVSSFRQTGS